MYDDPSLSHEDEFEGFGTEDKINTDQNETSTDVIKLNDDGSGLGTYGNYTYAITDEVTLNNSSVTFNGLGNISSNYTLTTNTSAFTSTTTLYTSNITAL